jgi:quinol monooxygenase YgiN
MEHDSGLYSLVVRFQLRGGSEEAFDALTAETVAAIRSEEPGTLAYVVHREPASPGIRVFYELYRNEDAFAAHEAAPHVKRFLAHRGQHLRQEPQVWRVEPIVGVIHPGADPSGA